MLAAAVVRPGFPGRPASAEAVAPVGRPIGVADRRGCWPRSLRRFAVPFRRRCRHALEQCRPRPLALGLLRRECGLGARHRVQVLIVLIIVHSE